MATQLNDELIRRMLDAQGTNPVAPFDPTTITKAVGSGIDLADTIQARKQAQEDRVATLAQKIKEATSQREQQKRVRSFAAAPTNPALRAEAFPVEEGKFQQDLALQRQKDAANQALLTGKQAATDSSLGLTPGQIATDKAFAKDFIGFETKGGRQSAEKGIGRIDEAISTLEKQTKQGSLKTGIRRSIGALNSPNIQALVTPGQRDLEDKVLSNVTATLRATLGAQFTEREGTKIFGFAFNSALPPETNLKKVKELKMELVGAKKAMEDASAHFKQFGTLSNYPGKKFILGGQAYDAKSILEDEAGIAPETADVLGAPDQQPDINSFFK